MIILITGAAQGIGYAIAKSVSSQNNVLLLADLNSVLLDKVTKELVPYNRQVIGFPSDLTQASTREKLISIIKSELSWVDVLINNAGIAHNLTNLTQITDSEFDREIAVNLKLPFQLMKEIIPIMQRRNSGCVINISSTANIEGRENLSLYSATKAGLTALTNSVAKELKEVPIKVISINPGRTNTPMQARVRGQEEATAAQSPDIIGITISDILTGKLAVKNGSQIVIKDSQVKVTEPTS